MTDRDPRAEKLLEELMPVPEPPADTAARVLAALAGEALPVVGAPAPAKPTRRPRIVAVFVAAAAVVALVAGLGLWRRAGVETGELVATHEETIEIGARATAAAETGAALSWRLEGPRARVVQRGGSVFYKVRH